MALRNAQAREPRCKEGEAQRATAGGWRRAASPRRPVASQLSVSCPLRIAHRATCIGGRGTEASIEFEILRKALRSGALRSLSAMRTCGLAYLRLAAQRTSTCVLRSAYCALRRRIGTVRVPCTLAPRGNALALDGPHGAARKRTSSCGAEVVIWGTNTR